MMKLSRNFYSVVLALVLAGGGFFLLLGSMRQTDNVEEVQTVREHNFLDASQYEHNPEVFNRSRRDIQVTDGVKHSVPLEELVGGASGKDGVPSIDNPTFTSVKEAQSFLNDSDVGIAFKWAGEDRFYPFSILVYHGIVNDSVDGNPILITYCPLCLSGIVFEPIVNGEYVQFGTSGKLWNSNLVMYDRKTNSYWSQLLGEAIIGEVTGAKLPALPFDQTRFGDWKKKYPKGHVLSKETGAKEFYGRDLFSDYYSTSGRYFPAADEQDSRLSPKEYILGVVLNGQAKAYVPSMIKEAGRIEDEVAGVRVVAEYLKDLDVVHMYKSEKDGELIRLNPLPAFWFAWAAVHPKTEIYQEL